MSYTGITSGQLCYSKVSLSCTVFSDVLLQCSSLIQSKLHASFQRPLRGLCRGLMEATELMERPEGGLHQAPVHYFKRHEVEELRPPPVELMQTHACSDPAAAQQKAVLLSSSSHPKLGQVSRML